MFPYLPPSLSRASSTRNPSLGNPVHHSTHHTPDTLLYPHTRLSNTRVRMGSPRFATSNVVHSALTVGVTPRYMSSMAPGYPPITSENSLAPIPSSWGFLNEEHSRPSSFHYATQPSPPLHTRPLYATIPLPEVSITDEWESHHRIATSRRASVVNASSSSSAPPLPLNSRPQTPSRGVSFPYETTPVQLHPVLQSAYLSLRQTSSEAYGPVRNTAWTPFRYQPATWPSVENLTILIRSTGDTISVRPSTHQSSFIVSVEDVIRELVGTFIITSDCVCYRPPQSCMCDKLSVLVNSLQLWFVDEGAPGKHRPWQLAVGRR